MFALQWGYDQDLSELNGIIANGIIHERIIETIKKTAEEFIWILKPHPVQLRNARYKTHLRFLDSLEKENGNVIYKDSFEIPTQLLLTYSDALLTMSSMTCYDASLMGVISLGLCPSINENGIYSSYFKDIEEKGFFVRGNINNYDIIGWIRSLNKFEKRMTIAETEETELFQKIKKIVNKKF